MLTRNLEPFVSVVRGALLGVARHAISEHDERAIVNSASSASLPTASAWKVVEELLAPTLG
jgi:hypothetical protein